MTDHQADPDDWTLAGIPGGEDGFMGADERIDQGAWLSTVGSRFRAERERLGLSQAKAAALCGTTQSAVSQMEAGQKPTLLETTWRWCVAIGADPHQVDPRLAPARPKGKRPSKSAATSPE